MKHALYRLSALLIFTCAWLTGAIAQQPVHQDTPFLQEYSVKFYPEASGKPLLSTASDRNGRIQVVAATGVYHPNNGRFLYPGKLIYDNTYRFMKDKAIKAVIRHDDQLTYLSDKVVFSNAWAGKLYIPHQLPQARLIAGGNHFQFLVSDGKSIQLLEEAQGVTWKGAVPSDEVIALRHQKNANAFWILGKKTLSVFSPATKTLTTVFKGAGLTAFDIAETGNKIFIGTSDGLIVYNISTKEQDGPLNKRLPWTEITEVTTIGDKVWFGTTQGAFAMRPDGGFDYYNGGRWLTDNHVLQIAEGPGNSVLLLTKTGLSQMTFKAMTLHDKAIFFDRQVRSRHLRNGFNATLVGMKNGDPGTGYLSDSDNDGLWTSMYLGAEAYRYAVTKDPEALQQCRESLEAMERLYSINPVPGFPARSFERTGHIKELSDPERWQRSAYPDWDWKATTSSDEAIGHIFVFGVLAELVDDEDIRRRAVTLIDTLMDHILRHNMYLVDFDGKPTQWGRWHPEYVNGFPVSVGDRKLNSSNIVAMLQTAYHFTKKEKYKTKAFELMKDHGYFENLMRPMDMVGRTENADALAKTLSDGWNHSDDEMYFLGYWGLYRYAFNDTLKARYKTAIIDHWEAERPEKEGLWNIFTAITGTPEFDLKEAVWYLQQHPLDLITWGISNSHRKDIDLLAPNFRRQTTKEVLPPDERPVQRHNGNMFNIDRKHENGSAELSAGDVWLLPYWLGRYLGVISAPVE